MHGLSSIRAINAQAAALYRDQQAAKSARAGQQARRDVSGGAAVRPRPPELNGAAVRPGRFAGTD